MSCYKFRDSTEVYTHAEMIKRVGSQLMLETHLSSGVVQNASCDLIAKKPLDANGDGIFFFGRLEDLTIRDFLILLVVIKLSQTPHGLSLLKEWGKSFFRIMEHALDSLAKASAANPITAWANPYLISCVLERFGFVSGGRMREFRTGLSIISGAGVVEGFIDTLQGIFPFSSPEKPEFPSQIDLGDKTYILEKPEIPRYVPKEAKEKTVTKAEAE